MFINLEKMRSKRLLITPVNWHRLWNSESSVQLALWAATAIPMDHHAVTEPTARAYGETRRETGIPCREEDVLF